MTKNLPAKASNALAVVNSHGGKRAEENRFSVRQSSLIRAAIHTNMASHLMKTTIEIADDIFERVQRLARKEKTSFRSLTEQGLRLVLKERQRKPKKLPPLVTMRSSKTLRGKNSVTKSTVDAAHDRG
jgi:hypothetical protein